ncbi:MAG TPA: hypothetical protein VGM88_10445 [Kofleriaceae bacterium]|jgi:hypothetical protein
MRIVLALALVVGCSGDAPPVTDGGGMRDCTGVAYDLCSDEHDCDTNMCHTFATQMFQVCTLACDASTPCPADSSGNPAACTGGLCVPAAANRCTLLP